MSTPSEQPPALRESDHDLERLEASLRWLQRQEAATRLARIGSLSHGGVPMAVDAGQQPPEPAPLPAEGSRSPLSLEPALVKPPPSGSQRSLRAPLFIMFVSGCAASLVSYLSVGGGDPPQSTQRPQATSSHARLVMPTSPVIAPPPGPMIEAGDASAPAPEAEIIPVAPSGEQAPSAPPTSGAELAGPPKPKHALDPVEIDLLIKRGDQFAATGDLVTARIVFRRAAEAGHAGAAMALAATYDPAILARLGVLGIAADAQEARTWYKKAESLGAAEATGRLQVLANR